MGRRKKGPRQSTAPKIRHEQVVAESKSAEIVKDFLAGVPYTALARKHGIHHRTVWRIVERARDEWYSDSSKEFKDDLPRRMAELEHIKREAWEQWYRSKRNEEQKSTEETRAIDGTTLKVSRKVLGRLGSAAYLETIHKTIRTQAELTGLLKNSTDGNKTQSPQVLEIIVETKEQAEEIKTLSYDDYKQRKQA
jgi:hypothetical protein